MKIGLILPGNIWFCPYVNIYTKILDKEKIQYDLISWNRDGSECQGIQFDRRFEVNGILSKLISYIKYASFVKKTIRKHNYDKLIVFGPQVAIFINGFLAKYYSKRYIFDYRDLSIEQKFYFKNAFLKVLHNSYANVISSPGFKRCLPKGFDYLLSHNFNIDLVHQALSSKKVDNLNFATINVLTIGGIRDYSSNIEVVKALANKKEFLVKFIGKGSAAGLIKDYALQNKIDNIQFEGFYPKEKESEYIKESTFLNIFYPRIISHDTALSNRFYNALIYRKPMVVTADTTQGDYVKQHNLGLSLSDCSNLDIKMREYLSRLDYIAFSERCNALLKHFLSDYDNLEAKIKAFILKP